MRGALLGKTELQRLPFPANALLVKIKFIFYFKKLMFFLLKILESFIMLY